MPKISLIAKQDIFFDKTGSAEDWRLAEKVVAIVESYFQPQPSLTYSTKRIKNRYGDAEELDVVFVPVGDPTSHFNFVQVRDRSEPGGRPWIQQLIGQEETLGSGKGMLVSTAGFADTAKRIAKDREIPIRTLKQVEIIKGQIWWPPEFNVSMRQFSVEQLAVVASLGGEATTIEYSKAEVATARPFTLGQASIRKSAISPQDFFAGVVMPNSTLRSAIATNFDSHPDDSTMTLILEVESREPFVWVTQKGRDELLPALAIVIAVRRELVKVNAPISSRYIYEDAQTDAPLAECVLGEFDVLGVKNYISLVRFRCDGQNCQIGGAVFA